MLLNPLISNSQQLCLEGGWKRYVLQVRNVEIVKVTDQQDQVNPIDDSFEKDKDKHQVQISSPQDQDKTEYLELLQNIEIERDTTKI